MTAKVLKRSRAKLVSKQTVEQMGVVLQELPEKTPDTLSLRQTIERLREPIEAALAKGYSYDELVPMLAQQGINIQPSTLKRYVLSGGDRSTRKRSTGKTRRSRKQTGDAVGLSAPAEAQLTVDLTELSETDSAPTPRKRGRAAAKTTAAESVAQPESTKQTRSRQTSPKASTATRARSTSTRGRRAKA